MTNTRLTDHYLYVTWTNIKARCYNDECPQYRWYGARGIVLWEPWVNDSRAFTQWVDDHLGLRPVGHTLDRIDPDKDYAPGNLRWADRPTQIRNRRPQPNKHYPGIHKTGRGGYEARIHRDGKRISLGSSYDAYEAACLYADAKGTPRPVRKDNEHPSPILDRSSHPLSEHELADFAAKFAEAFGNG